MALPLSKKQAVEEMWRRGLLFWKLDPCQKELYKLFYESNSKINTWLLARRSGKCLKRGTMIATPTGPKPIEEFKAGDVVYGYNLDGSTSPTTVVELVNSGKKQVRDLINRGKVLETSTDEHPWLFTNYKGQQFQAKLGETHGRTHKLHRIEIDIPGGNVHEPHAYAIGALLGDGCSKQNIAGKTRRIYLSSENDIIPIAVGQVLNAPYVSRCSQKNYTWCLSTSEGCVPSEQSVYCHYYDEWIKNRYAHQKIVDLNIIKQWDRTSQLSYLAGLIDTDGSVAITKKDKSLVITIGMQAKIVIESIQYLILSLFQYDVNIQVDDRIKYKNGPVYFLSIKNNAINKRILKALDPYLQVYRKKWSPEYETLLEHNFKKTSVGFKRSALYEADCFDLSIDNETHLYLTAKGFVTHNTFALCVLALEQCLKHPNSIVKFVSPTKVQVNNNVRPLFKKILEDCPGDIRPEFKSKDYIYYFPNGSEIQLAGTDNKHAEKLRGGDSHMWFIDEAGSCSELDNVVKSILLPTTLITKGKGVLASTPPKDSEHDFLRFIEEAELGGTLIKKTIYDNPRITAADVAEAEKECGGKYTDTFRREFGCELLKDASTAVIPEFTDELQKEIIKEWPTPPFYDTYEAMDLGYTDLTVILFGYFDFRADKVIIQDELVVEGTNLQLPTFIKDIKLREKILWENPLTDEIKKPYLRISDINYIVTSEISRASNGELNFISPRKDDNGAAINDLRVMLGAKKIIIHPRCVHLIRHLKNVKWMSAKNKTKFGRSPDNGHYDAVDALKYFIRSVVYTKNPYPPGYGMNTKDLYVVRPEKFSQSEAQFDLYRKIFNTKRKN